MTQPHVCEDSLENIKTSVEEIANELFDWFRENGMKANPGKCGFITNRQNPLSLTLNENLNIKSTNCVKLLGINIDSELNFKTHINFICKKANQKLHALARVSNSMDIEKRKVLFHAFFQSQFSYCPLVWMMHTKELNNKINRLQEKCLRIVFADNESPFEDLLVKAKTKTIHQQNIQKLCIEMYKVKNNQSPPNIFRYFSQKHYKI